MDKLPQPPSSAGLASIAKSAIAILASGGLDSSILWAESLGRYQAVWPLYVRNGLVWEAEEQCHLRRFLEAVPGSAARPLQTLELPATDLYGDHWSLTGRGMPDAGTPDSAVYLPGRNVLLLAKALLWCDLNDVPALALAVLEGNP